MTSDLTAWYLWIIMFAVISCCCGAISSYYRRKRMERMNTGQRPPYPYQFATPSVAVQSNMISTPVQPGVYSPQAPPAYNSANTITTYQPGGETNTFPKEFALPPSYAEVCDTSSKYEAPSAAAGAPANAAPAGAPASATPASAPPASAPPASAPASVTSANSTSVTIPDGST